MSIVVKDLNHVYMQGTPFETHALVDVNWKVETGEIVGLIGHTGSGKSTLIQHLNGLLRPTSGSVTVEGMDLSAKKLDRKQLVRKVGLVFQYPEYQLFEENVRKDIAFGPRNLGWEEERVQAEVERAAALVGVDLATRGEDSPFELSGGEKRRVALAGVLAMQPSVLVLDEPMAGLDPQGREDVLRLIREVREQRGCTIVVVSHSMDDMARIAGRIAVMQNGRIVMEGSPREVFANADALFAMGLELPQTLELCRLLRQKGVELPADIQQMEELVEYVAKRLGKA